MAASTAPPNGWFDPGLRDLCDGSVPDHNFPELTFNLQGIIGPDSGHAAATLELSRSMFEGTLPRHHFLAGHPGYLPSIGRTGPPVAAPATGHHDEALKSLPQDSESSNIDRKKKKNVDKSSDEYLRFGIRNNMAVRKCREKARVLSTETERKVSELVSGNDLGRKRVEMLSEELKLLKSLLAKAGVPPDWADCELAEGMRMDNCHGPGGGLQDL